MAEFEIGPIRPPNEAKSLLLRFTRNCPWNQCLFCPVYKGKKFSLRSVDEIKRDIDIARDIADEIKALSWSLGEAGDISDQVISYIFSSPNYSESFRSIAMWLYYGTGNCFIQDADSLVMKTKDLVEVLRYLRKRFPEVKRVTSYSRARTVVRKSVESLKEIRDAGLDRIHIGLESGYDSVLKFMKKGVSAKQHIEAGRKVIEAGMELSEYVMPGLGGQDMWKEHAIETAKVLNEINSNFIRLRSLRVPSRAPLYEKLRKGEFKMQSDDMIVEEIRLLIETLDGISSYITSDHIMNLLEDISGKLPEDKEKMLNVIERYKNLPEHERLIYRIGRRGGVYRSIDDLYSDSDTYRKIENLMNQIIDERGQKGLEEFISEMADRYV